MPKGPSPKDVSLWTKLHENMDLALHAAFYTWPAGQIQRGWVLDLGSEFGFGSQLISLSNAALQVIGMDLDLAGLRYSKSISGNKKISHVHGNAHQLPIASESLDGIYLIHLLHLVDEPEFILAEAWRALKQGGVGIVAMPHEQFVISCPNAARKIELVRNAVTRYFSDVHYPDEIFGQLPTFPPQAFRVNRQASNWLTICRKG